jgi:toxin-antitoxin system PIN domain toxin
MLIDANLLIYAVNRDLPQHAAARSWLEDTFSQSEPVGLPWVVILAFLRLCTNPRVFTSPMSVERAIAYIDEWLALPAVSVVGPGLQHWSIFSTLLTQTGTAGNLTTDAHIAALAVESGCGIYSADNDFRRFPGVRHINPLAM